MTQPSAPTGRLRHALGRTFAAFRHREFRIYFTGQVISVTGTWMQQVAIGWLALLLTGSPFALGLVAAARSLPILLFSFAGGIAADRYSRRTLLMIANTAAGVFSVALAFLTLTDLITIEMLVGLAFLLGITNALEIPSRQSFIVQLAGRADLANAIALNSLQFNTARVLGPALAGIVVALAGPGPAFALNAVSYVPVLIGLVMLRTRERPATPPGVREALARTLGYLRTEPRLSSVLLLVAANTMLASGHLYLGPAIARDLGEGADGFGVLMSAVGVGAVLAGLVLATRATDRNDGRWRGLLAAATVLGLSELAVAFVPSFTAALVVFTAVGWAWVSVNAITNTIVQSLVREEYRGRVMSLYTVVMLGFMPGGSVILGAIGDATSSAVAMGVGGGTWVVVAWLAFALRPELRRL